MQTQFIADLHLDPTQPAITQQFLTFLSQQTAETDALYILGDLFETWVGDDNTETLSKDVASALRQLSQTVPIYFTHGNRDFLLGEDYAAQAGMQLLPETHKIDLYGVPTLLMHGDTLCTDDTDYQAFRAKVRNPAWQQQILALPLVQRQQLASQLRANSQAANREKAEDITDVNPTTVLDVMRQHNVKQLIHGHTHRPAIHDLQAELGQNSRRIVLSDWDQGRASVLTCRPDVPPELISIS